MPGFDTGERPERACQYRERIFGVVDALASVVDNEIIIIDGPQIVRLAG